MQKVELELKDWKDMEIQAIHQIRDAKKLLLISTEILVLTTININKIGGETEGERIQRVKKEQEEKNQNK
ncbi:MAG: hypothetical protein U9N86_10330 [Bacteroidota bacterium]|nr:hypothetical protein [Bacteroidota bacterium]